MEDDDPGFNIPGFFSNAFEEARAMYDSGGWGSTADNNTTTSQTAHPTASANREPPEPRTCRICLDTTTETEDPELGKLFSPCKCTGTAKYVHTECLKQWRLQSANEASYFKCPTCQYKYKLRRLKWAQIVASSAMQISLTVLILLVTVFLLGFIADPIINFYLEPHYSFAPSYFSVGGFTFSSFGSSYYRNYPPRTPPPPSTPRNKKSFSLTEHMLRGLTSLGLIGFVKAVFLVPQFWFRMTFGGGAGGRRHGEGRQNGRDRLGQLGWIMVAFGVINFLILVWRFVRHRTKGFLNGLADGVLDISEDPDAEPVQAQQTAPRPSAQEKED